MWLKCTKGQSCTKGKFSSKILWHEDKFAPSVKFAQFTIFHWLSFLQESIKNKKKTEIKKAKRLTIIKAVKKVKGNSDSENINNIITNENCY